MTSTLPPDTPDTLPARTWAEVDLRAITHNARVCREALGGGGDAVVAVVKADGYGHGAVAVARAAERGGMTGFAVASVAEAQELRDGGVGGEIYLLSPFLPHEAGAIAALGVTAMVSSGEQMAALAHAGRPVAAFVMVDTGMGREGALPDEARALWEWAQTSATLTITGVATHLSSADEDDPAGHAATHAQVAGFVRFLRSLPSDAVAKANAGRGMWLSVCNSPAALGRLIPDADLPPHRGWLHRAGLLLYGIEPFPRAFAASGWGLALRPALSWRARVTLVRDLPTGSSVGYGRTFTTSRPSRIATVAAGYADGLERDLGNRGAVLIGGERFSLVGRVSMDGCQADVTGAARPVETGDIATLIGTDSAATQTAGDYAQLAQTTPHEPTCRLSRRVPRLYNGE